MRATTIPDVSRIARALQRPGIDPRAWVSLALVQSVVVDADGAFCDVLLVPSNRRHTARLGAAYAGSGWGMYAPPQVDDEVVVMAPDGDPSAGLVVVSRVWSRVDAPPTEAQENPEDVVLVVRPDRSLRLSVSGGGKVYLGSADGSQPAALGQTTQDYLAQVQTLFDTLLAWTPIAGDGGAALKTALVAALTPPPTLPNVRAELVEVK